MSLRFRKLPFASLLALCFAAAGAGAQSRNDSVWLPVWDNTSGKVEAYLVLEPADAPQVDNRWRFGNNSLDAAFGLGAGNSLGLLCNGASGMIGALGNLANNCQLASLGDGNHRASASASLTRRGGKLGVTAARNTAVPAWLMPGTARNQAEVTDLTVFAQKNIRSKGFVSIAGTVARAHLVPASEAAPDLADRWSSKSLTVGGGYGAFGASIVGHVVDTPGQSAFSGLGLGLTWRTPWSGQLTVGADNVVTRGKNPFSAAIGDGDSDGGAEGAIPYVRYEQDL